MDFEARAIEEEDFHGIRRLLQQVCVCIIPAHTPPMHQSISSLHLSQVFLKASVDLSGLTTLITAQKDIGSTIKVCSHG